MKAFQKLYNIFVPINPTLRQVTYGSMCIWFASRKFDTRKTHLFFKSQLQPVKPQRKVAFLPIFDDYSWLLKPVHNLHKQAYVGKWLLNLLNRFKGWCNGPNNFSTRSLRLEKTIMFQLGGKSEVVLSFCKGLYISEIFLPSFYWLVNRYW